MGRLFSLMRLFGVFLFFTDLLLLVGLGSLVNIILKEKSYAFHHHWYYRYIRFILFKICIFKVCFIWKRFILLHNVSFSFFFIWSFMVCFILLYLALKYGRLPVAYEEKKPVWMKKPLSPRLADLEKRKIFVYLVSFILLFLWLFLAYQLK